MRGWGSALATSRLDKGCFGDGGLPLSPILADVQNLYGIIPFLFKITDIKSLRIIAN